MVGYEEFADVVWDLVGFQFLKGVESRSSLSRGSLLLTIWNTAGVPIIPDQTAGTNEWMRHLLPSISSWRTETSMV